MKLRRLTAMISTVNDYSILKWPLTISSVFITLLAVLLLLSFHSNAWFTYEMIYVHNVSTTPNTTIRYSRMIEHGSFGLWRFCSSKYNNKVMKCDKYTRESRPQHFSVIVILLSCALFLSNLAFFPYWASTLLILYNTNNRYISHILVFLWIVLLLSLTITAILISIMMLVGSTKFYAPGIGVSGLNHIIYQPGSGLVLVLCGTILSIICLLAVIMSLLWRKFIEVKLIEADKELYKQLADDHFQPGWNKPIRIPRTTTTFLGDLNEPPPYTYDNEGANN